MNKKKIFWITGISLVVITVCALIGGFSLLAYQSMRGDSVRFGSGDAVALIHVDGIIQPGKAPSDVFSSVSGAYSDDIVDQLKDADDDSTVKAVVMRVDSPGGGVVASDEIYEQVAAMNKPVLVSMGTLAASGGYYISAPAKEIWANRHTLTGSIGVIIEFINIEQLTTKYGIKVNTVQSGVNKDTGSMYRAMTPEEKAIWQSIIDDSYNIFVKIVAQGRNLDEQTVRRLADGRVYTGQQALDLGLVDNLGNVDQVITRAAELGGIEGNPRIIDYSLNNASLLGGIFGTLNRPSPVEEAQTLLHLNTSPSLMYLYTGK